MQRSISILKSKAMNRTFPQVKAYSRTSFHQSPLTKRRSKEIVHEKRFDIIDPIPTQQEPKDHEYRPPPQNDLTLKRAMAKGVSSNHPSVQGMHHTTYKINHCLAAFRHKKIATHKSRRI